MTISEYIEFIRINQAKNKWLSCTEKVNKVNVGIKLFGEWVQVIRISDGITLIEDSTHSKNMKSARQFVQTFLEQNLPKFN